MGGGDLSPGLVCVRPTGADGVGWVAVGPVETTLAGTNIGSSGTGPAVGRAGSAGPFPEFRFEGAREASWTTYRRQNKIKQNTENKNKRGGRVKKNNTVGCNSSQRQAAVASVGEQKLHLFSSAKAPYLQTKC